MVTQNNFCFLYIITFAGLGPLTNANPVTDPTLEGILNPTEEFKLENMEEGSNQEQFSSYDIDLDQGWVLALVIGTPIVVMCILCCIGYFCLARRRRSSPGAVIR